MSMMSLEQARDHLDKHLAQSRKASHSLVVAHLMRQLAEAMRHDAVLWEIVGLCHDLDDAVTKNNRQLHGILTAEWLKSDLPREALDAIKAHDHRTGFRADTKIADALKLADALAVAAEDAGRDMVAKIGTDDGWQQLSERLMDRPYLLPIIADLSERLNLNLRRLGDLFENSPRQ